MSEITCPSCNRANPSTNLYCTACGINLRITGVAEIERQSLARELESVRGQLDGVSRELDRLQNRISRLEGDRSIPTQPQPPGQDVQAPAPSQPSRPRPAASRQTSHGTGRPFPKRRPTGGPMDRRVQAQRP